MRHWIVVPALAIVLSVLAPGRTALAQVAWDGGGDGVNWNDPLNWDGDVLPGPADDVTIDVADDPIVVFDGGTASIASLVSAERLRLAGGDFLVAGIANLSADVSLEGGRLAGGQFAFSNGAILNCDGSTENRIDGVDLDGTVRIGGRLRISGGSDIEAIEMEAGSEVGFAPGEIISGTLRSVGGGFARPHVAMDGTDGTLTIGPGGQIIADQSVGPGISIGTGLLGGAMTLVNQGSIRSTSRLIQITAAVLDNQSLIEVTGQSGRIEFNSPAWSNTGTIRAAGDGAVAFVSDLATSQIGTLVNDGGSVSFEGVLNNSDSIASFDGSGRYELVGGVLSGGQIIFSNGAILNCDGSTENRIDGVDLDGTVRIGGRLRMSGGSDIEAIEMEAGSEVGFAPGEIISGTLRSVGGGFARPHVAMDGTDGTLTIGPGGQIIADQSVGPGISIGTGLLGGAMTLVNQGSIRSTSRLIQITAAVLDNQSLIEVTGQSGRIAFNSPAWSNTGTLRATSSGRLEFESDIDLLGSTLTLSGEGGSHMLTGGSFLNGSIAFQDGARLNTTQTSTLSGTQVNGTVLVDSGTLRIVDGTEFTTAIVKGGSTLAFAPESVVTGQVRGQHGSGTQRLIVEEPGGTLTIGPTGSIVLSSGTMGIGQLGLGGPMDLINQGLISPSPGTIFIESATFQNDGLVETTDSGSNVSIESDDWSNTGTIRASAGSVDLRGTYSTAQAGLLEIAGGTIRFGGMLDNTGSTLTLTGTNGTFNLQGGISGGTIDLVDGARLVSTGTSTLSGTQVNGTVRVEPNSLLRIVDGTEFDNVFVQNSATLAFAPGSVITGTVWPQTGGAGDGDIIVEEPGGSLTVGPTGRLRRNAFGTTRIGQSGGPMDLINDGTIDLSFGRFTIVPATFQNNGLIETTTDSNARISVEADSWSNSGTIRATTGRVEALGAWTNTGTFATTAGSGSRITLNGIWSSTGTLDVSLGGTIELLGTTTDAGSITDGAPAGRVVLRGTFDNTGQTYTFGAGSGDLEVEGGSIIGGTIDGPGIGPGSVGRIVPVGTGNVIQDVTLGPTGVIDIRGGAALAGQGTLTINGTIFVGQGTPGAQSEFIVDSAVTEVNGDGGFVIGTRGTVASAVGGAATFTSGLDFTGIGLESSFIGQPGATIVVEGPIVAGNGTDPVSLEVRGDSVFLDGQIEATPNAVLDVPVLSNYDAANRRITGGEYSEAGGLINLPAGTVIERLRSTFILEAGGDFDELDTLQIIESAAGADPAGRVRLQGGRDLAVTPDSGLTQNQAQIDLAVQSEFVIGGDYQQSADGEYVVEIGQDLKGALQNGLIVADGGDFLVDGALTVRFEDGYEPRCGQEFTVMEARGGGGGKGGSGGGSFPILSVDPLPPSIDPFTDVILRPIVPSEGTVVLAVVCDPGAYSGPDDGSWFDPDNWGGGIGGVPNASTVVWIPYPVRVDQFGAVAASVTIVEGGALTVGGLASGSLATPTMLIQAGGTLQLGSGGSVDVSGSLTIESGATLIVDSGASLEVGQLDVQPGANLILAGGAIAFAGGFLDFPDGLDVGPDLTLTLTDVQTTIGADLTVSGLLYVDGGSLSVAAGLTVFDTASTTLAGPLVATVNGVAAAESGALLEIDTGATLSAGMVEIQAGATLTGSGSIEGPALLAGTISPGTDAAPIGTLDFITGPTLTAGTTLELELDPGSGEGEGEGIPTADRLAVNAPLPLDGTLRIVLPTDVFPEIGDEYVLASGVPITGELATVELPDPGPFVKWLFEVTPEQIRLLGRLQGDADGSGVVDFNDILEVIVSWGPCFGCGADLDNDGEVGFDDLLLVLGAFGGEG